MNKKEFLTEFLTGIGFKVLKWELFASNTNRITIQNTENGIVDSVIVFVDRSRSNFDTVSVKFKWSSRCIDAKKNSPISKDFISKASNWLKDNVEDVDEKNVVVDWVRYKSTGHGYSSHTGRGYLRIRSKGYLWDRKKYVNKPQSEQSVSPTDNILSEYSQDNKEHSKIGLFQKFLNIFR